MVRRDGTVASTAMKLLACWAFVLSLLATGCCKSESQGSDRGDKPADITITKGPDGGVQVTGGPNMSGTPKDCAAFTACCTAPEAGLFCGLAEASGKDCAAALTSVRNFLKEQGAQPPAGCM